MQSLLKVAPPTPHVFFLVLFPHLVQHSSAQHAYYSHLRVHPGVNEIDRDLHVLRPILELPGHVTHPASPKNAANSGKALVCANLPLLPAINSRLEELIVHLLLSSLTLDHLHWITYSASESCQNKLRKADRVVPM